VWWEGSCAPAPAHLIDWEGNDWTPDCGRLVAHANARFTTPVTQCPVAAPEWEDPAGVPISAIIIGGRRGSTIPLVNESFDWNHGVFLGSIMGSETTVAAIGLAAGVRRDPFAMLPFMGYHVGDYLQHWLDMGKKTDASKLPKIYFVNWFRKNEEDKFIWPGYGENSRVLMWITERIAGIGKAITTPIGNLPAVGAINTDALDISEADMATLSQVNTEEWLAEVESIKENYESYGERLPQELVVQLERLKERLSQQ
jgi:phosphoenolpyruvate carboxykinase (GTP)